MRTVAWGHLKSGLLGMIIGVTFATATLATASSFATLTYREFDGMPDASRALYIQGLVEGMGGGVALSKVAIMKGKDIDTVVSQFGDCITHATNDDIVAWATEGIPPVAKQMPDAPLVGAFLSIGITTHCGLRF